MIAAMLSMAGAISATVLAVPRILAALGENGDLPDVFARVRGAQAAPVVATLTVTGIILLLAITGTFRWALAVTSGSMMIMFGAVCASLPRLRILRPSAAALRVPMGGTVGILGVALSVLLLFQLKLGEAAFIGVTVAIAAANWMLVKSRQPRSR